MNLHSNKKRKHLIPHQAFNDDEDETIAEPLQSESSYKAANGDCRANEEEASRLKDVGCLQAEEGQYSLALNTWYQALQFHHLFGILHELRAQIFLAMNDPFHACLEAEHSVKLNPTWTEGYHTLARARRELGELELSYEAYHFAWGLIAQKRDQSFGMAASETPIMLQSTSLPLGSNSANLLATSTPSHLSVNEAELFTEMEEVNMLLKQLRAQRLQYEQSLTGIHDEAKACLVNLSSRAMNFAISIHQQFPDASIDANDGSEVAHGSFSGDIPILMDD